MAKKPAIFFSHASKDRESLLALKSALDRITGESLDIFLSSDGQSIPFGENWVHSIEEGLNKAEIMFVFVTQNSLQSDWIFFESGFAYSKGIKVIPVGIGVDVGTLRPPLSLMQGFNINQLESLNNIITVINDKFDLKFKPSFLNSEYNKICAAYSPQSIILNKAIEEIISNIGVYFKDGQKHTQDVEILFSKCKEYFTSQEIKFTYEKKGVAECLLINGIALIKRQEYTDKIIELRISPYKFEDSLNLLINLECNILDEEAKKQKGGISVLCNEKYNYIFKPEDISSIISDEEGFSLSKTNTDGFVFKSLDFSIEKHNTTTYLFIDFPFENNSVIEIVELLNKLFELKIIHSKY